MRLMASLAIAFATYSRVPMPQVEWSEENRRYAFCFFPLVGAVMGALLALWLYLCDRWALGGALRGAVGALLPLLVTGGIHMDGFMDTSDALASWQSPEKRLEILKDSHVGAFAVINCGGYLILSAGIFSECAFSLALPLGACFVLSRGMSAWLSVSMKQARPGGMLDGFAKTAAGRAVGIAALGYGALCAAAFGAGLGWRMAFPLAGAALAAVHYRRMAMKYFGGVTGDLAGWFLQTAEIAMAAGVLLGGKIG